jgi:hypothetical protein
MFEAGAVVTVAEDARDAEAMRLRACGASSSAKAVGNCVAGARIASVPIGSGVAALAPSSIVTTLGVTETFDATGAPADAFVGVDISALASNVEDLVSSAAAIERRSEFRSSPDLAASTPPASANEAATVEASEATGAVDALVRRSLAEIRSLGRTAVMRSRCGADVGGAVKAARGASPPATAEKDGIPAASVGAADARSSFGARSPGADADMRLSIGAVKEVRARSLSAGPPDQGLATGCEAAESSTLIAASGRAREAVATARAESPTGAELGASVEIGGFGVVAVETDRDAPTSTLAESFCGREIDGLRAPASNASIAAPAVRSVCAP